MDLTPRQRELARHALGLPNVTRRSYRNRFVAAEGHGDHPDWMEMVSAGDAKVAKKQKAFDGSDYFRLTEQGARKALKANESLCPEDFPSDDKERANG